MINCLKYFISEILFLHERECNFKCKKSCEYSLYSTIVEIHFKCKRHEINIHAILRGRFQV